MIGWRAGVWTLTVVATVGLAQAALGDPDVPVAAPDAGGEARPGDGAVAPSEEAKPAPTPAAPARLADGVFVADVDAGGNLGTLWMTVVGGAVVDAGLEIGGGRMPLKAFAAPNTSPVGMVGRRNTDFLRVSLETFNPDRGAGTFEGTIQRQQVRGALTLERR